jgi:hypothetical protein
MVALDEAMLEIENALDQFSWSILLTSSFFLSATTDPERHCLLGTERHLSQFQELLLNPIVTHGTRGCPFGFFGSSV